MWRIINILITILAILVLTLGNGAIRPVLAAEEATVFIDAPERVAPDSEFTAYVNISQVANFDAGNYNISFDPAVLILDSITSGQIGDTVIPVDLWNGTDRGTVTIVQNVPGLTGVSGSGYLSLLHFRIIGHTGDSSEISLSKGILSSTLAEKIPATWIEDIVDVSVIPGDANGDGFVNAVDITKLERIVAGLDTPTPGSDTNVDGSVNALDITTVEGITVGLDRV